MKRYQTLLAVIFFFIYLGLGFSQNSNYYYSCIYIDGAVMGQQISSTYASYHLRNYNSHNNNFAFKNKLNSNWASYNAIKERGEHLFSTGFYNVNGQRNIHVTRNSSGIPWWSFDIATGNYEEFNAVHVEFKSKSSEQVYLAGTTKFGLGLNDEKRMIFLSAGIKNSNQSPMVLLLHHISNYNHANSILQGSECNDMVISRDQHSFLLAGNSKDRASIV